ncbi:RNA ligase/cyclic nucleotide phosphodiesterase [Schizophyllum commune]
MSVSQVLNPLEGLLNTTNGTELAIQKLYEDHRRTGYDKGRTAFLSPTLFEHLRVDPILAALEKARTQLALDLDQIDTRQCLTLVAIPAASVVALGQSIQARLKAVAPNLWLAPASNMHITLLELVVAKTKMDVEETIQKLGSEMVERLVGYPKAHPTRLLRPRLNIDLGGLALSFVPEAGRMQEAAKDPPYTYLHMRRDLYALAGEAGITPQARYAVPSAHITLARFVSDEDFVAPTDQEKEKEAAGEKVAEFVQLVDAINLELGASELVWTAGEAGVELRRGRTWYGGGDVVCRAEGNNI